MIRVENLRKQFGGRQGLTVAVNDLSFNVEEGEFFTLLGPSGCGKTTTLRCIAGLERPTSGVITIGDQTVYRDRVLVPTFQRGLGMVFQSYAIWPHMTVFDNVAFPLTVRDRRVRGDVRKLVNDHLELVGLGGLESRMATQLSGGQQQRLSLARALVSSPKVLLLDEPLSNLDAKLRERMRGELRDIQRRVGITTVFVTHDQVEALSMSDRIAVMQGGRFAQLGTPEEVYHQPASSFVASFIGGSNLVDGRVSEIHGGQVSLDTAIGPLRGVRCGPIRAGDWAVGSIRLEDVVLCAEAPDGGAGDTVLRGRIAMRQFNGPWVDYQVEVPGGCLQARASSRQTLPAGGDVVAVLPPDYVRILPADAGAPADNDAMPPARSADGDANIG